jgi:hypothetical protein
MFVAGALIISLGSCKEGFVLGSSSPGKSGSAPGQVKKTTGSQSAKPYAPGQEKKKK